MPTSHFSRGTVIIGKMTCDACPTQFDCTLPDGSQGTIHYRNEILGVYDDQWQPWSYTEDFDTWAVTREQVADWLTKEGFEVRMANE